MQLLRLLIRFRFHTDKIFIKDHNFLLVMFLNEILKNVCILFVLKKKWYEQVVYMYQICRKID